MKDAVDLWVDEPCRMFVAEEWGLTLVSLKCSVDRPAKAAREPVLLDI
jgi:hypothetical protein